MRPEKSEIYNLTREQIAEKFEVSLRTAVRWQKYYGIFKSKIERLNPVQEERIKSLFKEGKSAKDCSRLSGYSLTTVYRVLNDLCNQKTPTADVSVSYNPN